MKYRKIEIDEVEAWKVNQEEIDNQSYPDFIKYGFDEKRIQLKTHLFAINSGLIGVVEITKGMQKVFTDSSYIIYRKDKDVFDCINCRDFESEYKLVEGE